MQRDADALGYWIVGGGFCGRDTTNGWTEIEWSAENSTGEEEKQVDCGRF